MAALPPRSISDRLAELRGPVPPRHHDARTIAALTANPGCARRAVLDAAGVDKRALAERIGFGPRFGQSPFAISRGNAFEKLVKSDGGATLLALLRDEVGLVVEGHRDGCTEGHGDESGAEVEDESGVGDGPGDDDDRWVDLGEGDREQRYQRTRELIAAIAKGAVADDAMADDAADAVAADDAAEGVAADDVADGVADEAAARAVSDEAVANKAVARAPLVDHPLLKLDVGGRAAYVEPDLVAFRAQVRAHAGAEARARAGVEAGTGAEARTGDAAARAGESSPRWYLAEIKSFAVIDGRADPVKVAEAATQAAVYVLAFQKLLADLGLPTGDVATDVVLICPKDFTNTPTAALVDVRRQLAAVRRQLDRLPRIGELLGNLDAGITFDLSQDADGAPVRGAGELGKAVATIEARYAPECVSRCDMAFYCRDEARSGGCTDLLGRSVRDALGGVGSVQQVLALSEARGGGTEARGVPGETRGAGGESCGVRSEGVGGESRGARSEARGVGGESRGGWSESRGVRGEARGVGGVGEVRGVYGFEGEEGEDYADLVEAARLLSTARRARREALDEAAARGAVA